VRRNGSESGDERGKFEDEVDELRFRVCACICKRVSGGMSLMGGRVQMVVEMERRIAKRDVFWGHGRLASTRRVS
jgi:hypothetical protein